MGKKRKQKGERPTILTDQVIRDTEDLLDTLLEELDVLTELHKEQKHMMDRVRRTLMCLKVMPRE